MLYQDSEYNWIAFERRREVDFMGVKCNIAAPEDLIISKLKWYAMSKSDKQAGNLHHISIMSPACRLGVVKVSY